MCYTGWHYAWNIVQGSSDLETSDCHHFYGCSGRILVPVTGGGTEKGLGVATAMGLCTSRPLLSAVRGRLSPRARTLDMEQQTTASSLGSNSRKMTWGPKKTPSEFLTDSPRRSGDGGGRTGRPSRNVARRTSNSLWDANVSDSLSLTSLWVRCPLGRASLGDQQPQR